MPKLKTNSGASKRFYATASGRLKHKRAFRNHILTKKSVKRKSHLRANVMVCPSDQKAIERLLSIS